MKATEIPFINLVGIEQHKDELSLSIETKVLNHIQTIHAAAQFSLAEAQSGIYLQTLFPEMEGLVIPLLRDAQIKYKKPATQKIVAFPSIEEDSIIKFKEQFERKGRGTIQVDVKIKDIDDVLTTQATFTWFIQKI